jgi:hypothetical protein
MDFNRTSSLSKQLDWLCNMAIHLVRERQKFHLLSDVGCTLFLQLSHRFQPGTSVFYHHLLSEKNILFHQHAFNLEKFKEMVYVLTTLNFSLTCYQTVDKSDFPGQTLFISNRLDPCRIHSLPHPSSLR